MQVADNASVEEVAPDADAAVKEEETAVVDAGDVAVALKTNKGYWARNAPPLMTAAFEGDVETTQELLHARADVNVTFAKKGRGTTPIFYAIRIGHDEIVRLLLQPDIDITNKALEAAKAAGPESDVYCVFAERGLLQQESSAQPAAQSKPKALPTAEPFLRHRRSTITAGKVRLVPRRDNGISPHEISPPYADSDLEKSSPRHSLDDWTPDS